MPRAIGIGIGTAFGGSVGEAPFSPLDLSPALWLDASDTSTITESSGAVSQWNDKSGNGRHVSQGTAASQPTTGSVTLNGLNVLSFIEPKRLIRNSTWALSAYTVAMVWVPTALNNSDFSVAYSFNEAGSGMGVRPTLAPYDNHFASPFQASNNTASLNSWGIHVSACEPNAQTLRWNKTTVQTASAASAATTLTEIRVGRQFDGAVGTSGNKNIAELIVCDSALTFSQIADLEDYLATKWGL